MTKEQIIITVLATVSFILLITVIVLGNKLKTKNRSKADNVKIKKGVRYTTDKKETTEFGDVKITHLEKDVILNRDVTYIVKKGGKIIPGKYTVLTAGESADSFNLRVGGFVRTFNHADDIVLNEGDEICAVSHSVILR